MRARGEVVATPEPGVSLVYRVLTRGEAGSHRHEVAIQFARGCPDVVSRRVLEAFRDSVALAAMRRDYDFIVARAAAVRFRSRATASALVLEFS